MANLMRITAAFAPPKINKHTKKVKNQINKYHGLCTTTDPRKLRALMDAADEPDSVNTTFKQITGGDGNEALDDSDADVPPPFAPVAALPPPCINSDVETMRKAALQVLRATPHTLVEMKETATLEIINPQTGLPETITCHFDNCSHSSGKQRAYIACRDTGHKLCFHYRTVDNFPSLKHAAAHNFAWSLAVNHPDWGFNGQRMSKQDHLRFNPKQEFVDKALAELRMG